MERWIWQHLLQRHANTNTVFRIHSLVTINTFYYQKCKVVLLSNNSPPKYPEDTVTYWGILGSTIMSTYKHRKDRNRNRKDWICDCRHLHIDVVQHL